MESWIVTEFEVLWKVLVSTVLILSILIVIVRISGLRSFAKMSSIDFATTIAIGSVLATTLVSKDPPLLQGAFAVAFILSFQTLFAKLILRFPKLNQLLCNQPLLLMDGSTILYDNLHKTNLSEADLMAKLREANVIQLSEVKAVVLETTGDISVLHGAEDKDLADALLLSVRN